MRPLKHSWKRHGRTGLYSRRSPYERTLPIRRRIATDILSYGYDSDDDDNEISALYEGIEAWLRGWKDFEDEFQSRQQAKTAGESIN